MRKNFVLAPLALVSCMAMFAACSDSSNNTNDQTLVEGESSASIDDDGIGTGSSDSQTSGKSSSSKASIPEDLDVDPFEEEEESKTLHYVGGKDLRILEVMPTNVDYFDEFGEDPGWVEIYNGGVKPAELRGFSVVENLEKPRKWIIDSLTIPAGESMVIFCSNKNLTANVIKEDTDGEGKLRHWRLHTNWRLAKDGGSVYLIDKDWGIRDSVNFPALEAGISWGESNGEWYYYKKPTPGQDNDIQKGYKGFVEPVSLMESGFFSDEFELSAPTPKSGGVVRCTFDGSTPTESTEEFSDSRTIDKNTVVRCAEFVSGKISNKVTTGMYFVGETADMPVVSVSVDPEFFEKHYISVHCSEPKNCPSGLYEEVEYPAHVEYFENGSNSSGKAFAIEAGISLMGNYSRMEDKKSVAIVMREQYQDGRLHYPLFETRKETASKIKGFNLRNNGNRFVSDYLEDAMGGALLEGTDVDYQRSRQVVVFYNGKYYGIHDMRERFNPAFVENNHGINENNVQMVKHLGKSISGSNDADAVAYEEMLHYVATEFDYHKEEDFNKLQGMLDVGAYADYMIAEMYMHNGDWPGNNVRAWRTDKQPWRFMVYDLDHGFDWDWVVPGFSQSTNMFSWVKQGGGGSSCQGNSDEKCFHNVFKKLLKNDSFKRLYVNHAAVMLQNYLTAGRVKDILDEMSATLPESETDRDMAMYDRKNRGYTNACGKGFSITGSCMKTWAEERDGIFWNEVASEFGLTGSSIEVSIGATGSGNVLVDGMKLPKKNYDGKFYAGNKMLLTAVPEGSAVFSKWMDGSNENPRLVDPTDGADYTAVFR